MKYILKHSFLWSRYLLSPCWDYDNFTKLFTCNKNKNILQQYRVCSFLKNRIEKRTVKLRIHFFIFVFFHANVNDTFTFKGEERKNKIHYLSCDSISVFDKLIVITTFLKYIPSRIFFYRTEQNVFEFRITLQFL